MAQTWHQVRPGEVRTDCGGCHAHSQKPTDISLTLAGKADYKPFDLTTRTPLLTDAAGDQSGKRFDDTRTTGLRFDAAGVKNVEFRRDVQPILKASCVGCHTGKYEQQMGNLTLDDETPTRISNGPEVPNAYFRLAADNGQKARFGHQPIWHEGRWCFPNASRYVRMFQSRRSLLTWKILGMRTDGATNDDFPTETTPGDAATLAWKGKPLDPTRQNVARADLDYDGRQCPPPEAVAGTYRAPDDAAIRVAALSDGDKRTLIRWIDLGCPIDLDYNPAAPAARGYGWMLDDNRPTLALTLPRAGDNERVDRVLIGMHDYDTGIDPPTFSVTSDVEIDGVPAGQELAGRFLGTGEGIREWRLTKPLPPTARATLTVKVKDRQGNVATVERTFVVRPTTAGR